MNINHLLTTTSNELDNSDSARLDAEVLLSHILKVDRSYLFAHPEKDITDDEREQFSNLIEKRKQGVPVAHLVGNREFWSLQLKVTPDTLIPRPETEILVEKILEQISKNSTWKIVDLGTGSGAIALAIASERPACSVIATDLSSKALSIAKHNAQQLNIHNVEFITGHWFEPLEGKYFHVIVSNPPYIPEGDPHLKQGDVRFEPGSALVAGNDGLECIEQIVQEAHLYLEPEGLLAFEHGYEQGEAVRTLLKKHGYSDIHTASDLAELERATFGRLTN
jgi:release factor glutamine methyltransferase